MKKTTLKLIGINNNKNEKILRFNMPGEDGFLEKVVSLNKYDIQKMTRTIVDQAYADFTNRQLVNTFGVDYDGLDSIAVGTEVELWLDEIKFTLSFEELTSLEGLPFPDEFEGECLDCEVTDIFSDPRGIYVQFKTEEGYLHKLGIMYTEKNEETGVYEVALRKRFQQQAKLISKSPINSMQEIEDLIGTTVRVEIKRMNPNGKLFAQWVKFM